MPALVKQQVHLYGLRQDESFRAATSVLLAPDTLKDNIKSGVMQVTRRLRVGERAPRACPGKKALRLKTGRR